jgi:hypothetical protein
LRYERDVLWYDNQRVDLVYNRLTDFYLQSPSLAVLANAYRAGSIVLTPHRHAYALYANKDNLAVLTSEQTLRSMGVAQGIVDILIEGIPRTEEVVSRNAEQWWDDRKQWFFKPRNGFGSKGTYRGEKLSRKVFGEILEGGYVAQTFSKPGERWTVDSALKFDIRTYVYDGEIQQMAARLYQGQTTNFRTQGGGFAPVYSTDLGIHPHLATKYPY